MPSIESETRQVGVSRESFRFGVTFISNDLTPEVLQPGKQPLDFPPSSISLQPTSILSLIPLVPQWWTNGFNAVEPEFCVEAVGVVGVITNQVLRASSNIGRQQSQVQIYLQTTQVQRHNCGTTTA